MNHTGMGFGGGFASGLATVLNQKRQESERLKQRQIDNTWKSLQFILDSGQVSDVADLQPQFDTLTNMGAFGDPKQGKRGQPTAQDHVVKILGHVLGSNQGAQVPGGRPTVQPTAEPSGPDDAGNVQPNTALPSQALNVPQPQPERRSLMGIPLQTPTEVLQRKIGDEGTAVQARIDLARTRILPALKAVDPSATLDDALAAVGVKLPASNMYAPSFQHVTGKINGEPKTASFDARTGRFLDPVTREPLLGFVQDASGSGFKYGVDREAIAQQMFDKNYGDLTQEQSAVVLEAEQRLVHDKAENRVEGAGAGKMNVPADLSNARENNVPVGTTPAQVKDQLVPTQTQVDRRTSIETVKSQIEHIKTDLIGVLPKKDSPGGMAPGAYISMQRRTPEGRTKFAQLDAALDNIVNVLARGVGEQRGTQTEQDAERAYNAAVQARDSLLSPLKGDTQESAAARLDETLKTLEAILKVLPARPVPTVAPVPSHAPAAAAAAPAAATGAAAPVPGVFIDKATGKLVFQK